ncbi:MAG TPA: YmdB family metallophosphoesterase, partial [Vicinamibacterales bacterium]|nr:YmdB family metallophosphoesterase [Vicinamibacterales bacterium]
MRLLFIGDIVGRPGRELVRHGLPAVVEHHDIDLVIANAENAAAGFGITREIGDQLLDWGVDVMTSGNHIWDKREALDYIGAEPRLLRPANYPAGVPGRGSYLARTADGRSVGVVNVMGRVFMANIDDPFAVVLREIEALTTRARIIFVDFHAEA